MTEPSKEAIERACEMLNGATSNWSAENCSSNPIVVAFARFIQEVSDVARLNDMIVERFAQKMVLGQNWKDRAARVREANKALILPDPEPDVLAEACKAIIGESYVTIEPIQDAFIDDLRAEIAKRNHAVRKVSE